MDRQKKAAAVGGGWLARARAVWWATLLVAYIQMIFDSPCFITLLALVVGLERLPLNPRQAGNLTNIKAAPQVTRDRVSQIHISTPYASAGRQGSRRMRATRPIYTGRLNTSGSMSRTRSRTLPMTPWSRTALVSSNIS